jgi:hypothetical protein
MGHQMEFASFDMVTVTMLFLKSTSQLKFKFLLSRDKFSFRQLKKKQVQFLSLNYSFFLVNNSFNEENEKWVF